MNNEAGEQVCEPSARPVYEVSRVKDVVLYLKDSRDSWWRRVTMMLVYFCFVKIYATKSMLLKN